MALHPETLKRANKRGGIRGTIHVNDLELLDLYWSLPADLQRGFKGVLEAIVAERAKPQVGQLCVFWDPGDDKRPGGLWLQRRMP